MNADIELKVDDTYLVRICICSFSSSLNDELKNCSVLQPPPRVEPSIMGRRFKQFKCSERFSINIVQDMSYEVQ